MTAIVAKHNWPEIRQAYVTETPKPSYENLSERFSIPMGTLARVSSDEGWKDLRTTWLEERAAKGDALEIITRAATESSAVSGLVAEAAKAILAAIIEWMPSLSKVESPKSRIDMVNTASFALVNTATATDRAGIIGMSKILKARGEDAGAVDGHGKWDKGILVQINNTVASLQKSVETEPITDLATVIETDKPKSHK